MHGGMAMPAGLPMADRAPDRDGLMLDRLHLPLGPVLPFWPAGLVLHVGLQGDVVQEAAAEVLDAGGRAEPFWDGPWRRALAGDAVSRGAVARQRAACHLDSLARLLGVAGWEGRRWPLAACVTTCSAGSAALRWPCGSPGSRGGWVARGC